MLHYIGSTQPRMHRPCAISKISRPGIMPFEPARLCIVQDMSGPRRAIYGYPAFTRTQST
jgi:hypothetical protein